jgi:adenylosuccinate synthase
MICDTSVLLNNLVEQGKKVLFEGAQGVMLCIDHGTYPFVTSSSPTAASVPVNTGLAPRYVDNVMGVAKAYTTRVGEGPFPTELFDERAEYIRERGHEYGTVTGRPRRVGWLDAVVLNHVRRISGLNYLSLMLFDVLSGLEKIRICTGYKLDGEHIDYVPSTIAQLERVEAEYIELDGWSEDITAIKSYDELPANAKAYIAKVEELTRTEVAVVSVGPDREQTIIRKDIF